MNVILSIALKYLESHPDVVEKLVVALIEAVVAHLQTHKPTAA